MGAWGDRDVDNGTPLKNRGPDLGELLAGAKVHPKYHTGLSRTA